MALSDTLYDGDGAQLTQVLTDLACAGTDTNEYDEDPFAEYEIPSESPVAYMSDSAVRVVLSLFRKQDGKRILVFDALRIQTRMWNISTDCLSQVVFNGLWTRTLQWICTCIRWMMMWTEMMCPTFGRCATFRLGSSQGTTLENQWSTTLTGW